MSGLLSLVGWTFLPNLATNWVQTLYYAVVIRAGDPKPQPGTPRYAEHRRRIHILVVSLYLLYTVYAADQDLRRAGSLYADLGLSHAATERDVKSRFRRLAASYHPDKISASAGVNPEEANAFFIRLQRAADVLSDPARRFAYDRLGPSVVEWAGGVTIRDYVLRALQGLVPSYVAAAAGLWFLGWMGYLEWGRTWRWLTFLALLLFEVSVITRPGHPALFTNFINPVLGFLRPGSEPYLPFQAVSLFRKLSVTLYVAFSHIGPLLGADTSSGQIVTGGKGETADRSDEMLRQALARLEQTAGAIHQEAAAMLNLELVPFHGDAQAMSSVQGKMKDWLVNNTIRSDPMVKDALGTSLRRRRRVEAQGAR